MRVLSVSRRTDIPAFYTPWFLNRIQAGFCHWQNPFSRQVYQVSLRPEDVLAIVFWTRNPGPLLPHLPFLKTAGVPFYFLYTITGYPSFFDPHTPSVEHAIDTFKTLSRMLSPEQVIWRYDPIILSGETPPDWHLRNFSRLAQQLSGSTFRCIVSFVEPYGKTKRNFGTLPTALSQSIVDPILDEKRSLLQKMHQTAQHTSIQLFSCCNDALIGEGIQKARCIDPLLIESLCRHSVGSLKPKPSRKDCGCVASTDIGGYDTCLHGCLYCYATQNYSSAERNARRHDPRDSILIRPPHLQGADLATLSKPSAFSLSPALPTGDD